MQPNSISFQRLPKTIKPISYSLNFTPNASESTFYGKASILFKVLERSNSIVLNSKQIQIISAKCKFGIPQSISYDEQSELVTLSFNSPLEVGELVLDLEFKGLLGSDMQGFYRSTCNSGENEKEKIILCTQFEPTYARKAFPCMDEPDRKATFEISVTVLDHLVALSNMPEVSRTVVDTPPSCQPPSASSGHQYVTIQFAVSPIMSTYLVAMVIGHFDHIAAGDPNEVQIRVFTSPGNSHCGEHALRMARSALPFYADFFGIDYPLPKLDLVAIPDFSAGAMENWGLVTYRETSLLIDVLTSSLQSKRNVALTVAHELAHMWFGNLVTMQWWTHLWLNEGFATWIEYLAVNKCFPEYDIWSVFLTRELYSAMSADALKTSHPIEICVQSPNEVEEIFDAVSYEKGASIIRMLSDYLSLEVFKKGLQLYINRHKYSNTVTEDLWEALSEVCGESLNEMMSSWTQQTGFPVISIQEVENNDEQTMLLSIKQSRFFADGTSNTCSTEWYIPITICEASDSSVIIKRTIVPPSSVTDELPMLISIPCRDGVRPQIRLNPNAVGFYRVHYTGKMLSPIFDALGRRQLVSNDRLSLLSDQFALARAGHCSYVSALSLASSLTGEMNYTIWCELANELDYLRGLLQEASYISCDDVVLLPASPPELGLDDLIIHIALPIFNKLGWCPKSENESQNDQLLRPLLIGLLGMAGHLETVTEARKRLEAHCADIFQETSGDQSGKNTIPPDLRMAVYSVCMKHGDEKEWQCLLRLHDNAKMQDERVRILYCLGKTRIPSLVHRLITLSFSDFVRKQDRFRPLISLSNSPGGRRALLSLVKERIAFLNDELGGTSLLGYVIKSCCEGFCTMNYVSELQTFFEDNPVPCARAIEQALESITVNAKILQRDTEHITQFLVQFKELF